jgi:hypothetical protein
VVPTLRFECLFAFLVVGHGRRQLLWFAVTRHPTAEWLAQQIVEAFPWGTAPTYLVRDNDGAYGGRPSIDPDRAEARRRDLDRDTRPRFSPVAPRPDSVAGLRGLELANVILGKWLKCWANSPWITRTFWDLRPFARKLHQDCHWLISSGPDRPRARADVRTTTESYCKATAIFG